MYGRGKTKISKETLSPANGRCLSPRPHHRSPNARKGLPILNSLGDTSLSPKPQNYYNGKDALECKKRSVTLTSQNGMEKFTIVVFCP